MPTLTPVDNDPFAPPSGTAPKLTPVDHDPFATTGSGTSSQSAHLGVTDPFLAQSPNESWSSSILRHLHAASSAISDWPTLGIADKIFGPQAQADTAAAHQQMGAWDLPLSLAGSAVSAGPELKAASAIGEAAAPYLAKLPLTGTGKWLGGVLGTGAVGAPISGLGEYGHEAGWTPDVSAIGKASTIGGALSAGTGMFGGVVGRGGALAPPVSEGALRATAKQEYAPLDEMVFHGPSQVKPALDAVTNTMTQSEKDLAASTMAKVNKLADTNLATGSDIQSYQKIFGGLSKTGSDMDREFAPQFKSALENVMQADPYGRNLTPGKGMSLMPSGQLGGTGFPTGAAAAARDAGNIPFGRANDVARLDDPTKGWIAQSQVAGGPDVGDQISSWLRTATGQRYAPPPAAGAAPNAFTAYNTAAGTAAKPEAIPWYVKHFMIAPAVGTLANEGFAAATGQEHSPMEHLAADLGIGATLMSTGLAYRGLTGKVNQLAQQRALDALRSTISTGNYQAPLQPLAPLRDWVRSAIYGGGGGGKY